LLLAIGDTFENAEVGMVNVLTRHRSSLPGGILHRRYGRFPVIVCCGLLLQSTIVFAQMEGWAREPTSFAGVPFDSSRAEALAKVKPGGSVSPGWEGMMFSALDLGLSEPLRLRWSFEKDKFAGVVSNNFSSGLGDFEKLRAILIEQYGQPTSTQVETVQNLAGAKFQNEILRWRGKTVAIMLMKYLGTLDHGVFSLSLLDSPEEAAERQKKEDEARKKAAEKLK
jgi:hypothetical protein